MNLLSTQPYKGTRDFFPEEMRSRDWMFSILSQVSESFGFEKIDAPLIEPIDIYLAKTSEEIVNQQMYSFVDRGERKVAIRPEMTPTVSRMVAQKIRELAKPIRWYSIPNLWRYERPGKGRLREHWQLNCDLFGAPNEFLADVEILQLSVELLRAFGATSANFKVRINHRQILNSVFERILGLPPVLWNSIARIMDKKEKIPAEEYMTMMREATLTPEQIAIIDKYMTQGVDFLEEYKDQLAENGGRYISEILVMTRDLGLGDYISYDASIVRGFDYYTGLVFEIFDAHPENRRSLFGGGRYDNLVSSFVKSSVNAVGFGMGDVTLVEFLKTHGLYKTPGRKTQIYVASFDETEMQKNAFTLAQLLRGQGFEVEMSLGPNKIGKQFQEADAKKIPVVVLQGATEKEQGMITMKILGTGNQETVPETEIVAKLTEILG